MDFNGTPHIEISTTVPVIPLWEEHVLYKVHSIYILHISRHNICMSTLQLYTIIHRKQLSISLHTIFKWLTNCALTWTYSYKII